MLRGSYLIRCYSRFVPEHEMPLVEECRHFHNFLNNFNDIIVLTGAGVSTESGIPDYRSEKVGVFTRTSYKPIQYSEFLKNPDARKRYWARNFVGWPRFKSFFPNSVHFSILGLEIARKARVITQNVDGLHSKAGSRNVIELHGNAFWVTCLNCKHTIHRNDFQQILQEKNPSVNITGNEIRPDGDIEINEEDAENFEVPFCEKCGGIMKPTVTFFGDNVPKKLVKETEKLVENCDSMLILGTSLSTLSSYRLVQQAYDSNKYICIVNIGPTKGDKMANLKISTKISNLFNNEIQNMFS